VRTYLLSPSCCLSLAEERLFAHQRPPFSQAALNDAPTPSRVNCVRTTYTRPLAADWNSGIMPPRPDGTCRHCCGNGWIVGRGLCRKCYASPGVRNLYRTYRVKRRALRGMTHGHCVICGRWRYITGRERCQSCYRLYAIATIENKSTQSEREARIEEYMRRAARRLPLFTCGNGKS
jgi:hypothetical protein